MSDATNETDPGDIAFLALGANKACKAMPGENYFQLTKNMGFIEIIQAVIAHAPLLSQIYRELDPDAVWYYEVAEPVGYAIVMRMLTGGPVTEEFIRERVSEFLASAS